jgi:uncharacterized membrane protein
VAAAAVAAAVAAAPVGAAAPVVVTPATTRAATTVTGDLVRPTLEDPLARSASEGVGGPAGPRSAGHPWWTPVRVVLAVAAVACLLGMLQKTPCVQQGWSGGVERYAALCYSDTPYLYVGRGFVERVVPFTDTGGRFDVLEYPVLTGYFAYGAAVLTHLLSGWPDVDARAAMPVADLQNAPGVGDEVHLYFQLTAVLLAGFALLTAWFLARTHRNRPWDAMLFAASPALVLTGLINWDLVAVAAVAGACWAWSRGRPGWAGVMIGLGTAVKLYPLFLLGALLVVCLRRRTPDRFLLAAGGAVVTWLAVNLPVMAYGFEQWRVFWSFNDGRGADLGSLWLVWQESGHQITPAAINTASWIWFGALCVAVLALGLLAPRTPRIPQLALLIVIGFLLVNKVYSPQYVLWILPLAVLARPRWRDLLLWQAAEAFYFVAVWFYLGEFTASAATGEADHTYWLAIVVRVAAQLWLAGVVVRDILVPRLDPVRADGLTDDPMDPVQPVRVGRRRVR